MTNNLISVNKLFKSYSHRNIKIPILKNINLTIKENDIISISGPSGVGKSTLLNILGLLDIFDSGSFYFDKKSVRDLSKNEKNLFRNEKIGFVHQFFYLIPELTVLENVAITNMIKTNNKNASYSYAKYLLELFKLENRINFKPSYLSGGEQQRVAIARALINKPKLLIADEMTGNLDENTANDIFDFFITEIKKNNQTLIYATHNIEYANKAMEKYKLKNTSLIKI